MQRIALFLSGLLFSLAALSQEEGTWEVFLAQYDNGPGSTVLNMELKQKAPISGYTVVVITGVKFTNCNPDGFPADDEFEKLHVIEDSVEKLLAKFTSTILAGTFTNACQRLGYYYITDSSVVRQQLLQLYSRSFPGYTPYIKVRYDPQWEGYLTFLYPSEEMLEYTSNLKVLDGLAQAGDKLDKPRQTDHWLYFKNEADRNCFIKYATSKRFKVESKKKTEGKLPYQLQISRVDKVDIRSISGITSELRQEASKCNGDYDGWETFVVK